MNELKRIIETIVYREIEPDEAVFSSGYTISPVIMNTSLKGDGEPEEITTSYQLDFFYKSRGEAIAKAKALIDALGDYPTNDLTFTWEEIVRLWRGTILIETI